MIKKNEIHVKFNLRKIKEVTLFGKNRVTHFKKMINFLKKIPHFGHALIENHPYLFRKTSGTLSKVERPILDHHTKAHNLKSGGFHVKSKDLLQGIVTLCLFILIF